MPISRQAFFPWLADTGVGKYMRRVFFAMSKRLPVAGMDMGYRFDERLAR
jgi:hypothetical protein